ncbi:hypothetical protein E8D73_27725 [Escherichia coli]|uniref:Uncharacterized protein n=1 Tax=Escherichia coli TaxID=562 RepID=A0A6L6I8E7_ECOLX|nr:hypothetical protein [Escherichia coli]MDJ1278174.1 hypothetical protein [Escherichia coli]MTE92727.1 hypothetical protein [Escherichia coli]PCM33954.1 hypothetical protein B1028_21750 [Escherichia coli]HAG8765852.1 hypothetical protein [Escherichia coli]
MAADKMAAHNLRIITSRFSAIKKAPFLAPVYGLPRFYVSTSKSIIKALINMHSFEIQLSPIG